MEFLEKDVILQEDSVENIFCKEFEKLKHYPMSDEMSSVFISILYGSNNNPQMEKELYGLFPYQLMTKRLEVMYSYDLDLKTKLFLIYLTEGRPGAIVMYLTYLQYVSKKRNKNLIDFQTFVYIFPTGFPSDEDLHSLWSKQKVKATPDNLVDHINALKSIL